MSETNIGALSPGQKVIFKGFAATGQSDDIPANGNFAVSGEVYEILRIDPETDENEASAIIAVPNPDFDESKRATKKNAKHVELIVFGEEVTLDPVSASEVIAAVEKEGEETEEVAPPPKKTVSQKKAPAKKAPAKKPAKKTTKSVEAVDDGTKPDHEEDPNRQDNEPAKKPAKKTTKKSTKKAPAKAPIEKQDGLFDQDELDDTQNEPVKKATKKTTKKSTKKTEKTKAISADLYDEDKVLILTEEEEDQDILALVRETDDIIGLAQDEIHDASLTEYRLGGVLYHVKRSGDYKEVENGKYDRRGGWQDFISDVLNMEYRKATYLIQIYTKFSKYGIPAEEAALIGWTKASVIAGYMNADNAEDLIQYAEEQTVSELKETVKQIRTTGEKQVTKRIIFKFRLTEDAAIAVRELLEQAKIALGEGRSEDDLFEHIVTEWATEHLDVVAAQKAVRRGKGQ